MKKTLRNNNQGIALIYSLVIGVVAVMFGVMLLMVVYALFAQTSGQTSQLQCKLLAESCVERLEDELGDDNSELVRYISERINPSEDSTEPAWIAEDALNEPTDPGYDADAVRFIRIAMDDEDKLGNYTIVLTLSYEGNSEYGDGSGIEDDDNDPYEGSSPSGEEAPIAPPSITGNTIIHVKTEVTKGGVGGQNSQSYAITRDYNVNIS